MTRKLVSVDYYDIIEEDGVEYVVQGEDKVLARDFVFYRSAITGKIVSRQKLQYIFAKMDVKILLGFFRTNDLNAVLKSKWLQPVVFDNCHFINSVAIEVNKEKV